MSGQQVKRVRQPGPEDARGSFKDFLEESKSSPFAQPQKDDIISDEKVTAEYTSVEEGLCDESSYRPNIKGKISTETAEYYDLDQEEAHLALLYAKASKELARRTLTATPEEATRLKGMKRLASLTLDLCQRLKVAALLPSRLTDERQSDLAGQLSGTFQHLRKLEKTLFGETRTPQNDLVTKAEAQKKAYGRATLEASATPRRVDGDPHLAA